MVEYLWQSHPLVLYTFIDYFENSFVLVEIRLLWNKLESWLAGGYYNNWHN